MQFLNINVSVLSSPEYLFSDPCEQSAWLQLMGYCATQENGGRIEQCRLWTDARCLMVLRCSRETLDRKCSLWEWRGDDLVVHFYPKDQEKALRDKRKSCQKSAESRWEKLKKKASDSAANQHGADASAHANASTDAHASAHTDAHAEGKGREWKGMEDVCVSPELARIRSAEALVRLWPKQHGVEDGKLALLEALQTTTEAEIRSGTTAIVEAMRQGNPPGGVESNRFVEGAGAFFKRSGWVDSPQAYRERWTPKSQSENRSSGIAGSFVAEARAVRMPRITGLPETQTPAPCPTA